LGDFRYGNQQESDVLTRILHHLAPPANRLGDLVFAPQCAFCDAPLDESSPALLCAACCRELLKSDAPRCPRCAQTVPAEFSVGPDCPRCRGAKLRFDAATALGGYEGSLRRAVLRLKYPGGEALATALAELFWRERGRELTAAPIDVVAPVPMHWRRRLVRGANSPELVAEALGRRLALPVARGLLVRRRNTLPQADLPPSQRFRNLRGAFRPGAGYALKAARVLLVDDILTTGATCSAAVRVLHRAGAEMVRVAVLARAELTS
jgi:ComF family protein